MPQAKLNDISMYYEVHGKGEPIVFIAGFAADHTTWRNIIDTFKSHYQVILFDNRGTGQTDAPEGPYTIEAMSTDIASLCSRLNIKKAHFVGNSMGGFILQTLALNHPNLVKTAVISHSSLHVHQCFKLYMEAELELLEANAPLPALIKASLSWLFSYKFLSKPGVLDQQLQLILNNPHPFTLAGYKGQFAALKNFDSSTWVKHITIPTLVLGSDEDLIFNRTSIQCLMDKLPNAQGYQFTNCGHLPQLEQPNLFAQIVKEFISKASLANSC